MAVKFKVGVGNDKDDRRLSAARKKLPKPRRRSLSRELLRSPSWPLAQPNGDDEEQERTPEPPPEWAW